MKLTRESIIKQLKVMGFEESDITLPYWLSRVNYRNDDGGSRKSWEDVCMFRDDVLHYKLVMKDHHHNDTTCVSHITLDYHKVSSVGFWWGLNSILEMDSGA